MVENESLWFFVVSFDTRNWIALRITTRSQFQKRANRLWPNGMPRIHMRYAYVRIVAIRESCGTVATAPIIAHYTTISFNYFNFIRLKFSSTKNCRMRSHKLANRLRSIIWLISYTCINRLKGVDWNLHFKTFNLHFVSLFSEWSFHWNRSCAARKPVAKFVEYILQ